MRARENEGVINDDLQGDPSSRDGEGRSYPSNVDSIGIEMVAGTIGSGSEPSYEAATAQQNASLAWLIGEIRQNFHVPLTEVFRHPQVSYKDRHEAESARW